MIQALGSVSVRMAHHPHPFAASTVVQLLCERQFLWSTVSGSFILLIQLASQSLNHTMAQSFIRWLTMTHRPYKALTSAATC